MYNIDDRDFSDAEYLKQRIMGHTYKEIYISHEHILRLQRGEVLILETGSDTGESLFLISNSSTKE